MKFFCGVAVVEGKRWEALKRYNVNEMYRLEEPGKEQDKKQDTEPTEPEKEPEATKQSQE